MKSIEEKAELWDYYQDLVKSSGFDGITDLLAENKRLQAIVDAANAQQSSAVAVPDDILVMNKGILEDVKCDLERLQDDCLTSFNLDSQERALRHVKTRIEEITKIISTVIKPNESEALCTQCGFVGKEKDHQESSCYYETFKLITDFTSPRITEQDAREIAFSAIHSYSERYGFDVDKWLDSDCRALLAKLNNRA